MRKLIATLMLILPMMMCILLLRLGEVDWRQCLDAMGSTTLRPATLYPSWSMAATDISLSALRDLKSPVVFALLGGPFVGFALVFAFARTRSVVRANISTFCIWTLVIAYFLIDPSTHHDCDRKGTDTIFAFFLFAPLGLFLSGLVVATVALHHNRNPTISDT